MPRTRPLPAASGGTSTSLPPDAADWFRQATAEATSNTTSVHLFPDQLVLGGVIHPCGIATQCPFQPAIRHTSPRETPLEVFTDCWTINRRLYCPPTPQCSAPPNYKGTRLLGNRNCQLARHNITEHCCRTSKLKGNLIPLFAAKWMNGTFVKCHLPNAQKDCKTRERVNFV